LSKSLEMLADPRSVGFSGDRLALIAPWYQARVDAGDLVGAVVAIARQGRLALLEAVGFQDRARQVPLRPDAIFWIASMTKPITSVAAMNLTEGGELDLDAPVYRYLPELKDMQVAAKEIDRATGEVRLVLVPQRRPMTVRDLLRHTSGLVYPPQYTDSPVNRLYGEKAVFARDQTLADFVTSLAPLPLAHQPGEVWEYSWGVDVLARVIEVVADEPFDKVLHDRIFAPLQMIDTGFYVPEAKLARLVDPPPGGRHELWDVTKPPRLFSGGGGLVSTATDYLRFAQMLAGSGELDGARVLAPETIRVMTTVSLPPNIRFHARYDRAARWFELGARFRHPHRCRIEWRAGNRRQLFLGRRVGHVLLDRSCREAGRGVDDSDAARRSEALSRCTRRPDLWRVASRASPIGLEHRAKKVGTGFSRSTTLNQEPRA
jgi:CubicO group peptidase (beta-lactamase class C family)